MNKLPTAFDNPREAARKPRKVFYARENQTKTEGEIICCPFCGQELAHTQKSILSDSLLTVTNYVRSQGRWIKASKGAQTRKNHRQRERERRAVLKEKPEATPSEIARETRELKALHAAANRQIVTNARTGETKPLGAKGASIQTDVRADSTFLCEQCGGSVKIKVSK